ncbi:response regulator [Massilia sp. S19_KUP03_FR1]|uniref:response regulator n=1 Tax=Massilia sp. S19_KUP03_FR1 TaxID=3025503 RepID=UPI002FCD86DE
MLKALIIDASGVARGLLNTVLTEGGYEVVGSTHTMAQGIALAMKHRPQIICIARENIEDGSGVMEELRAKLPKSLIFMVSGAIDAATIQSSLALGVNGFIVKPFKHDAVLKTIRTAVLALIRKQQEATGDQ